MAAIEEPTATILSDGRRQLRSSIFLAAVMRYETEQVPVKIRNMSANGALVESLVTPLIGCKVDLLRGTHVAQGTVIWSLANRCGLRFASAVSVSDWLTAPTQVQQQRVDELVALVKAGGTSLVHDSVASAKARSSQQLAEDLEAVIRLIQDLGDDLASSEETVGRHGMKLQNLDIAMQIVQSVAGELTGSGGGGQ